MKKFSFLILFACVSITSKSQNLKGSSGISIIGNEAKIDTAFLNARYARVIKNVEGLKRTALPITNGTVVHVLGYYTPGDGGGGNYIWNDTSTATPDGGGIINIFGAQKGRFIHEVENGMVNLKWWGIRARVGYNDNTVYDIADKFENAQAFMSRNKDWSTLFIPADNGGTWGSYYSSRTLVIRNSITIIGDGSIQLPKTRIQFPQVTCMYIPYKDQAGNLMRTSISNLELYQEFTNNSGDSTAHGVHARSIVSLNNIFVSFAAGNGFHLEGCQSKGHPLEGTVDFAELINCQAKFTTNGLFIDGCDANKINVYKFNASAIRRWGVYDNGFLGNTYTSPHFAFCGSGSGSDVVVTYAGKHYAAISEYNFINKGFRPDQYPQYWQAVTPMGKGPAWEPGKKYYSGGPYHIRNDNAKTTIIDPYFEGFQPNAINSINTLSINGTRGVEIIGGVDLNATNAGLGLNTSLDISGLHNGVHVNKPSTIANYPAIAVKSHAAFPTVFHESSTQGYVYERYKNTDNDKGYFSYQGTSFMLQPNNVLSVEVTPVTIRLLKAQESTDESDKVLMMNPTTKEIKYAANSHLAPKYMFGEQFTGSTSQKIILNNNGIAGTLRLYKNGIRLSTSEYMYKGGTAINLNKPRLANDMIIADYHY